MLKLRWLERITGGEGNPWTKRTKVLQMWEENWLLPEESRWVDVPIEIEKEEKE